MDLNTQSHEEGTCEHAPIRGSITILVVKLLAALLLFEILYVGIYYVLMVGIPLPFDIHHHISLVLFLLIIIKILTQAFLIMFVILSWTNSIYYISGKYLIKRTGIINTNEDTYEFNTVRSVTMNQSLLGRIFHYGDVTLKTSASGGYQVIVTITGISNPLKYEQMIKQCL